MNGKEGRTIEFKSIGKIRDDETRHEAEEMVASRGGEETSGG
jgi:hypothetical protein